MRCPVIAVAVACLLVSEWRRRFLVVTVTGVSMLPALAPGDRLLVRRTSLSRVNAGQVAVVEQPDAALMIKRVAAIPGHRIPVACLRESGRSYPALVPRDTFIVLGDNPDRSYDSRHSGLIAGDLLVGVAVRRIGGFADGGSTLGIHRAPVLSAAS